MDAHLKNNDIKPECFLQIFEAAQKAVREWSRSGRSSNLLVWPNNHPELTRLQADLTAKRAALSAALENSMSARDEIFEEAANALEEAGWYASSPVIDNTECERQVSYSVEAVRSLKSAPNAGPSTLQMFEAAQNSVNEWLLSGRSANLFVWPNKHPELERLEADLATKRAAIVEIFAKPLLRRDEILNDAIHEVEISGWHQNSPDVDWNECRNQVQHSIDVLQNLKSPTTSLLPIAF